MAEAALQGLAVFADPSRLGFLLVGVLVGFVVGMLPGLSGIVAVSVLLPVIFRLDAHTALAVLIGALAVVYTSDTITSVLVGTPGSPASAPTAIEGHALARQGQAARALSAGFLSSMIGGFLGIFGLTLVIPFAGPLVMALGSPELFMFTVLGVTYAGSLLGRSAVKGLLAGLLGVLLGLIGPAPAAAQFRFTFDQLYLLDGLSLVVLVLGVFGLAEVVSLLASGGAIARTAVLGRGWTDGVRDVFVHRWHVVRGALIGLWAGLLPAIGATAGAWMAYGQTVATSRRRERFGRGDIRGIIGPESANNATAAGDLIPTLLFSVPGGPAAAVILGALYAFGIFPGPQLVQQHLDVVYVIVWSYVLANIIGGALAFALSPAFARITTVPFSLVAPPLLVTMALGAFQTTRHMGDLAALFALGLLGWAMKRSGWPRAPLLIGFVLARPMESYFWLTVQLHDWRWLGYPGVLAIGLLLVAPFLWTLARGLSPVSRRVAADVAPTTATPVPGLQPPATPRHARAADLPLAMAALALLAFAYAAWQAAHFEPHARLLPLVTALPGVALAGLLTVRSLRSQKAGGGGEGEGDDGGPVAIGTIRREALQFGFVGAYLVGIWLAGFHVATTLFLLAFLTLHARLRPLPAVVYTVIALAAFQAVANLLRLRWPAGLLLW
jgi:TctA family transporter